MAGGDDSPSDSRTAWASCSDSGLEAFRRRELSSTCIKKATAIAVRINTRIVSDMTPSKTLATVKEQRTNCALPAVR